MNRGGLFALVRLSGTTITRPNPKQMSLSFRRARRRARSRERGDVSVAGARAMRVHGNMYQEIGDVGVGRCTPPSRLR